MQTSRTAQQLCSAACLHTNQSRSYLNHLVPCAEQEREMTLGNRSKKAEIRHSKGFIDTVNCYSGVVNKNLKSP